MRNSENSIEYTILGIKGIIIKVIRGNSSHSSTPTTSRPHSLCLAEARTSKLCMLVLLHVCSPGASSQCDLLLWQMITKFQNELYLILRNLNLWVNFGHLHYTCLKAETCDKTPVWRVGMIFPCKCCMCSDEEQYITSMNLTRCD